MYSGREHSPRGDGTEKEDEMASVGSKSKRVKLEIEAEPSAEVCVAGTFNSWDPKQNKLKEKNGVYSCTLLLPKGRYEYKFVINDVWCVDPKCREWVPNNFGSLNSVVVVE